MNGTLQELAAILQGFGRGGDTMLAHITPSEAMLLDEVTDGGSINPITGIPEFYMGSEYGGPGGEFDTGGFAGQAGEFDSQLGSGFASPGSPGRDHGEFAQRDKLGFAGQAGEFDAQQVPDGFVDIGSRTVSVPTVDTLKNVDPTELAKALIEAPPTPEQFDPSDPRGELFGYGFANVPAPTANITGMSGSMTQVAPGKITTPPHALDQLAFDEVNYQAKMQNLQELNKAKSLLPGVSLKDPDQMPDPRVTQIDNQITSIIGSLTPAERNRMNVDGGKLLDSIFDIGTLSLVVPGGGLIQAGVETAFPGVTLGHLSDVTDALADKEQSVEIWGGEK